MKYFNFDIFKSFFQSAPPVKAPALPPHLNNILCTPANPDWEYVILHAKIDSSRLKEILGVSNSIRARIDEYKAVERAIGVPWYLVAGIAYREDDLYPFACLHNGDPLPGPTTHVPKGRGPFKSWADAAIDALLIEQHYFPKEWTPASTLAFAFRYNGRGYLKCGIYSPYITAGTDFYTAGKYASDGKFSPHEKDEQLGLIPIFNCLGVI